MMQLEIEREALRKEIDDASKARLEKIDSELAELRESTEALKARWQREKDAVDSLRQLREQIDTTKVDVDRASQNADYAKASELKYGRLAELERSLSDKEATLGSKPSRSWRKRSCARARVSAIRTNRLARSCSSVRPASAKPN
jgi:ATP-dependent Clp protease ATP-binding subunit ClpB